MEKFVLNICSVKKEEETNISKSFEGALPTSLTWGELTPKSKCLVSLKRNFD